MKKYYVVGLIGILMISLTFSGCLNSNEQEPETETGSFELLISDQPYDIDDFEYLNVTLSKSRVFVETNQTEDNETQYEELSLNNTEVDLTKVKGEKALSVLNSSLEAGNYSKIELYVNTTEGMTNGEEADIKVPSEKLQIVKGFEIRPDQATKFVFDISVVKKGPGNEYNLLPVISKSGVVGEDIEVEEIPGNED